MLIMAFASFATLLTKLSGMVAPTMVAKPMPM
jgi:hypothetical protein